MSRRTALRIAAIVAACMFTFPSAVRAQSGPSYAARMAFRPPPPPSELVLVRFATNDPLCAGFKAFRAEDGTGTPAPCRVVCTVSNAALVLVYTGGSANRSSEFYLYGAEPAWAQSENLVWTNQLMKVGVTVRQRNSPTLPNRWERFLYFWEKSSSISSTGVETEMDIADFAAMMVRMGEQQPVPLAAPNRTWRDRRAMDDTKKAAFRERYGRPASMVRMESQVLFPVDGEYRMALACRDSGYVLVDGELALAVESGAAPAAWQIGEPRWFAGGLHSLEVMTASLDPAIRVGWVRPRTSEIALIGEEPLVAPGPVVDGRFEVRGRFIHANFTHVPLDPYKFRDIPGVFLPFRFTDLSRNPGGAMLNRRWVIEGRSIEGPTALHTFTEPGMYPVHLVLSDSLGATGGCERVVDVRTRVVQEYAVDFEVGGLPPACFTDDPVNPYLVAWGKAPPGVAFRVAWTFLDSDTNAVAGGETNMTLAGPAVKVDFGKEDAGDLQSLRWSVSVAGKAIKGGDITFDRPPFAAWPHSVVADRLCDHAGGRTVLVTSLERSDETYGEADNALPATGPVIMVDDTLVPYGVMPGGARETCANLLSRLLDGPRDVRYASIAPPEDSGGSLKSLAKFVSLRKLAGEGADRTVVLAIGVHDLLLGGDVEAFERGLAVMVDRLLADKAAVVLVTPPPYPGMETRLRSIAVAVRRVGDARGVPVTDLYTAFIGMRGDGGPLFELDSLGLTARGHRLAAERIAAAMKRRMSE